MQSDHVFYCKQWCDWSLHLSISSYMSNSDNKSYDHKGVFISERVWMYSSLNNNEVKRVYYILDWYDNNIQCSGGHVTDVLANVTHSWWDSNQILHYICFQLQKSFKQEIDVTWYETVQTKELNTQSLTFNSLYFEQIMFGTAWDVHHVLERIIALIKCVFQIWGVLYMNQTPGGKSPGFWMPVGRTPPTYICHKQTPRGKTPGKSREIRESTPKNINQALTANAVSFFI